MSNELMMSIMENLYKGEDKLVAAQVRQALDGGIMPQDVLSQAMIKGMDVVGQDFKNHVLYVPEVLLAARAMKTGMEVLRPLLAETGVPSCGRYMIGTVEGDLHDIGKNLVKMMLEGSGFEVIDIGTNVPAAKFVEGVLEFKPDVMGMSALLTTTMVQMRATIEAVKEAGLRDSVKIMVGGAPLTQRYADEIGADAYGPDAATAVDLARKLVGLQLTSSH
jgi:5-methyltetrahydrofolate--homocysteine methyltransferase